jgi:hypothetical protein
VVEKKEENQAVPVVPVPVIPTIPIIPSINNIPPISNMPAIPILPFRLQPATIVSPPQTYSQVTEQRNDNPNLE